MKKISKKERSFGLHVQRIHFGVFDYSIIFVTGKIKYLQKYIRWKHHNKKFQLRISPCGSNGLLLTCPSYVDVIWMPRYPKTTDEVATLAHESLHAILGLFEWAGMELNMQTAEIATHVLGYMIREILDGR